MMMVKKILAFWLILVLYGVLNGQSLDVARKPAVLSARVRNGEIVYQLNGNRVEDTARNSLLKNLTKVLDAQGSDAPVFVIVDAHAPFSEFGKLETALDKVGLQNRRFFVTNFSDAIMNEIHWDNKAVPIPKS